jgi:hypothetical protein
MNHVEEQILECVAKLYPDAFALLDGFCRRHERFVEPKIAQFAHEVCFYLSYLTFIDRFTTAGLSFGYPEITTQPGALSVDDAFDLALAIKSTGEGQPLVCNDFRLSGRNRSSSSRDRTRAARRHLPERSANVLISRRWAARYRLGVPD